jgi:hypothetical protein
MQILTMRRPSPGDRGTTRGATSYDNCRVIDVEPQEEQGDLIPLAGQIALSFFART